MPIALCGLTTGNFATTLRDLPRCLEMCQQLGVESVELSMGAFDVIAGGRILAPRLAELRRICADSPLALTVHGPVSSSFTDRRHLSLQMDVCRATMEVASALGATAQVHHAGGAPADDAVERDAVFAQEREALATLAPEAAAAGVVLCVETIFGLNGLEFASPAELAAQIAAVDHPNIRATIDFSHCAINAGMRGFDLMAELAELAPYAGHLHIHDSFGRPRSFEPYTYGEAINFGLGDLHLPPGWGMLDWEAIAALPYPRDMSLVANLEVGPRFEEALPESIDLVRRMIAISAAT